MDYFFDEGDESCVRQIDDGGHWRGRCVLLDSEADGDGVLCEEARERFEEYLRSSFPAGTRYRGAIGRHEGIGGRSYLRYTVQLSLRGDLTENSDFSLGPFTDGTSGHIDGGLLKNLPPKGQSRKEAIDLLDDYCHRVDIFLNYLGGSDGVRFDGSVAERQDGVNKEALLTGVRSQEGE
jgi:hypothetical protein